MCHGRKKFFGDRPPPHPSWSVLSKEDFFFSTHCLNKVHFTRISCAAGTVPIYLSIYLPLALQIRWRSLGFSACSRRSDNRVGCWVKEQEKIRSLREGERQELSHHFLLHPLAAYATWRSPHNLNAWNRLRSSVYSPFWKASSVLDRDYSKFAGIIGGIKGLS